MCAACRNHRRHSVHYTEVVTMKLIRLVIWAALAIASVTLGIAISGGTGNTAEAALVFAIATLAVGRTTKYRFTRLVLNSLTRAKSRASSAYPREQSMPGWLMASSQNRDEDLDCADGTTGKSERCVSVSAGKLLKAGSSIVAP
jgi:hypothetical protein